MQLDRLFASYETQDEVVFIISGDFYSRVVEDFEDYYSCFSALNEVIGRFPRLSEHAVFVLIPGHSEPNIGGFLP
jgi:hypothetical protein